MSSGDPLVLSVQSHTVHGYVGNRSATFPLQLLGLEVDVINSVHFSNHTGYANGFKGTTLDGPQLWDIFEGLAANNLLHYTHLLTGYVRNTSFLRTILRVVEKLREVNPDLEYVCDPVMGDNGKLYVPEDLVAVYRTEIVKVATTMTPNQFEAKMLTGLEINGEQDAAKACCILHEQGVRTVIITSLEYPELEGKHLEMFASRAVGGGRVNQFRIMVPRLPAYYTGTGDLVAALLLAWTHRHPQQLDLALEKCNATMQAVMQRTAIAHNYGPGELKLIQSKRDIEDPQVTIRAERLDPCIRGLLISLEGFLLPPAPQDDTEAAQLQRCAEIELQSAAVVAFKELTINLEQMQVPFAIATSLGDRAFECLLQRLELPQAAFSAVVLLEHSVGALGPPLAQLGVGSDALLMVGSTVAQMQQGRDAGLATCLLLNTENTAVAEDHNLVDHSIRELQDVTQILRKSWVVSPPHSPTIKPLQGLPCLPAAPLIH